MSINEIDVWINLIAHVNRIDSIPDDASRQISNKLWYLLGEAFPDEPTILAQL